jgi:K+ transporter
VTLPLGVLGVVFGDIGTSPLYALRAAFTASGHPVAPTHDGVYGVVSLVFWTLTLGYHDAPDLPRALAQLARRGSGSGSGSENGLDPRHASYFFSRITLQRTGTRTMAAWREALFATLWRNQAEPGAGYRAPIDRTVTLGSVIEL